MLKDTFLFKNIETIYGFPIVNDPTYHQNQNQNFPDVLIKGLTDIVKCKDRRYLLTRSQRRRNSRKLR